MKTEQDAVKTEKCGKRGCGGRACCSAGGWACCRCMWSVLVLVALGMGAWGFWQSRCHAPPVIPAAPAAVAVVEKAPAVTAPAPAPTTDPRAS